MTEYDGMSIFGKFSPCQNLKFSLQKNQTDILLKHTRKIADNFENIKGNN